ncbi:hypothetical protein ACU4GD_09925 [Cupriavidus basilensis]
MKIINVTFFAKRLVSIVALAAAAGGVQAVSAAELASDHGAGPGAAAARSVERDPFTDGARSGERDVYTDGAACRWHRAIRRGPGSRVSASPTRGSDAAADSAADARPHQQP